MGMHHGRHEVHGNAGKVCGYASKGGEFVFAGLRWDGQGRLRLQERPFRGTRLLGGASRGRLLFFDREDRLHPRQHTPGKLVALDPAEWPRWRAKLEATLAFAGVPVMRNGGAPVVAVDGREYALTPEACRFVEPKGGLKGYESH